MTINTRKQRLLNLFDALAHDACIDAESAENDLRESGLDPDEIKKEGIHFVQGLQQRVRLNSAKFKRRQQESKLDKLRERFAERFRAQGEQAEDILGRLLSDQPELKLSFRKIKSLDPEDVAEILDEIQLLKFLSEMEEE
ncbi:MAG: hypothetical protein F4069_03420 [Rhodothermaceae bacterium]|nr:hypothetical protein [Rhodothermaceae bacterium]MYG68685.1 hypothetical protein [Rhodothermaceae bacterium]MYJ44367.1 hypothetical protein [Rhodothermaceae bacterium]